eukprot:symbB.v1.2.015348.t1/scaffold1094.1/size138377/13
MDTKSAVLDLAICAAYVSIPLQLLYVATRKVTTIDFRKITGNMSSDELSESRALLIAFALFIVFCGCGHGINAWKALSESSSDFLEAFQKTVHVGTALVSVSTSVLLGVWLPKLLSFCNDIEIHRKGYMKIMLEEQGEKYCQGGEASPVATSSALEQMKGSERELRSKVAMLEGKLKKMQDLYRENTRRAQDQIDLQQLEEASSSVHEKSKQLAKELEPLPNLLGKCQGAVSRARPKWAENPDGTWGDFHLLLRRILGQTPAGKSSLNIPSDCWLEVCIWCGSLSQQQLISILQSVLNFCSSPKPEKVVEIAEKLEPINAAA